MNNKFCHNCGKAMSTLDAKFCPFCGTSLGSLNSAPPKKQVATTFTPMLTNKEDDDDEYIDHLDHARISISALDFEVKSVNIGKETLGGVVMKGIMDGKPTDIETRDGPYLNSSNEQFLNDFQKEAGSIKRN